ncbi:MAG: aminoglycoside phosphotransferase family protein [Candidatus Rokubacteria bacterium]|nr:aminoglycoside phosphotransferase family protein [Candidatus Rokubacteria bacterium]
MPALEAVTQHDLPDALARVVGRPLAGWERLGEGRNSRVYTVRTDDGQAYLAKQYVPQGVGTRDRLAVEFSSLQFLWRHGVRDIPQPIAMDGATRWALYEFVEGRRVSAGEVTAAEIDAAVDFLGILKALTREPASRRCPIAAEACFSLQAILDQLQERMRRFPPDDGGEPHLRALHRFLREAFLPAWRTIRVWCLAQAERLGVPPARQLREEERTLSPSDFGFHNAIRRPDGRLVFVDFEYFGWDDPAKTIADVLLHPAMTLSDALKQRFVTQALRLGDKPAALARRLEVVYPLWGLKWCLILLNEFVPQDLSRRAFARPDARAGGEVHAEQLAKAQRMLERVTQDDAHFPYGNDCA